VADYRLPNLRAELQGKLQKVDEELHKLPQSFSDNAQVLLLNLCREFIADVESKTRKNRSYPQFFKQLYEIYLRLQKKIMDTKLRFSVDSDEPTSSQLEIPCIPTLIMPYEGDLSTAVTPATSSHTLSNDNAGPKGTGRDFYPYANRSVIPLSLVREIIKETSIGHLPTVVDSEAHDHYIRQFLSTWELLCLNAFEELEKTLKDHLLDMSKLHFARFSSSRFHGAVK